VATSGVDSCQIGKALGGGFFFGFFFGAIPLSCRISTTMVSSAVVRARLIPPAGTSRGSAPGGSGTRCHLVLVLVLLVVMMFRRSLLLREDGGDIGLRIVHFVSRDKVCSN
jgi:hypothetical protein